MSENQKKAYLIKVAYRLIIDKKRREIVERNKNPNLVLETNQWKKSVTAIDMEKIFKLLKPKERHLLWLAYVEGYTHREIASVTGGSEKSIRVQLYRIKKKFSGILKKNGYSQGELP